MIGSDDRTTMRGTELIQVIVPCVAIPLLLGIMLVAIHLCRRHRASAAVMSIKRPQATRRQHGAPSVVANNILGSYYIERLYFYVGGCSFLYVARGDGKAMVKVPFFCAAQTDAVLPSVCHGVRVSYNYIVMPR